MHHGTCVTHVPWCMSGSIARGGGENVPAFPAHAQTSILRIWQEAHAKCFSQNDGVAVSTWMSYNISQNLWMGLLIYVLMIPQKYHDNKGKSPYFLMVSCLLAFCLKYISPRNIYTYIYTTMKPYPYHKYWLINITGPPFKLHVLANNTLLLITTLLC